MVLKGHRSYWNFEGEAVYCTVWRTRPLSRLWTSRNEEYLVNDGCVRNELGDLGIVIRFSTATSDFLLYNVSSSYRPFQWGSLPCGTPCRVLACLVQVLMCGVVLPVSPRCLITYRARFTSASTTLPTDVDEITRRAFFGCAVTGLGRVLDLT